MFSPENIGESQGRQNHDVVVVVAVVVVLVVFVEVVVVGVEVAVVAAEVKV